MTKVLFQLSLLASMVPCAVEAFSAATAYRGPAFVVAIKPTTRVSTVAMTASMDVEDNPTDTDAVAAAFQNDDSLGPAPFFADTTATISDAAESALNAAQEFRESRKLAQQRLDELMGIQRQQSSSDVTLEVEAKDDQSEKELFSLESTDAVKDGVGTVSGDQGDRAPKKSLFERLAESVEAAQLAMWKDFQKMNKEPMYKEEEEKTDPFFFVIEQEKEAKADEVAISNGAMNLDKIEASVKDSITDQFEDQTKETEPTSGKSIVPHPPEMPPPIKVLKQSHPIPNLLK